MKLSELTKDQVVSTLNKVDQALGTKLTKSAIVAELASQKLCSPNSTGIENTLLKVAQKHAYVPPLFAKLMGVKPQVAEKSHPWIDKTEGLPPVPQTQTSKTGPAPKLERRLAPPVFVMSGLNIRALSIVEFTKKSTTVHLRDGTTIDHSNFSEETLKKNCKVVELGD
jgi:hypothetical protein